MIEEIGRLGRETFVILRICRHDDLDRFLADFLGRLGHAAGQKPRGVRSFGPHGRSRRYGARQPTQYVSTGVFLSPASPLRRFPAEYCREAGPHSRVTRRPGLLHPVQHRVAIAVQPDFGDPLDMPRGLPLLPQGAAGSAEIMGQTGGESSVKSVAVGKGDHQDVAGPALLGHDRHQSVSTESDRRQPNVLGHGEKLPAACTIVKSRCGPLSCCRSAVFLPVFVSLLPATRSLPYVRCPGLLLPAVFAVLTLGACSEGTGPGGGPTLDCTEASTLALSVGEHRIINPLEAGACVRLPAAGAADAEHLYIPVGTEGGESDEGVSAPYAIAGSSPGVAVRSPLRSPLLSAFLAPLPAAAFHGMLRARERELSRSPAVVSFDRGRIAPTAAPPPVVGEQRTFDVCATTSCTSFAPTTATAKVVGERVAVFLDDAAPAGGYTDLELTDVASLFDDHLYPIDTLAFGRESDIDGNGVVIVLLTHRVNELSPNCGATESVILGYFFGADLLPRSSSNPGSNESEIFYGLVPDPANPDCEITLQFALSLLPSTIVHEFQHMINFNQHRLVRGATSEDTWLNEGLSHFAEELAGRLVPDTECPASGSCFNDFLAQGNLVNSFEYLETPEEFFLIEPGNSSGRLQERGANWLFVRWLADHFAADTVLGTDLTRRLVATSMVGSENVAAQSGVSFSILVPEWQLTNYLDDLPGFSQPAGRLRYKTWNFREIAVSNSRPFPLVPDSTGGPGYNHIGVLRAGSGRHVRVVQPAGSGPVDLQLSGGPDEQFPTEVDPHIAVVRIR
jgi:hypothetical protein